MKTIVKHILILAYLVTMLGGTANAEPVFSDRGVKEIDPRIDEKLKEGLKPAKEPRKVPEGNPLAKPDYIITNVSARLGPFCCTNHYESFMYPLAGLVEIKNIGWDDTLSQVGARIIHIQESGGGSVEVRFNPLPRNGTQRISWRMRCSPQLLSNLIGNHQFQFTVDSTNQVPELNENNNTYNLPNARYPGLNITASNPQIDQSFLDFLSTGDFRVCN